MRGPIANHSRTSSTSDPGDRVSDLAIVSGSSHPALAGRIAGVLGVDLVDARSTRFPDGELDVSVDPAVRGRDTYVVQTLGPPVNEHLVELLLLADACRRAGARRLTAVIPYLGYARKDRRTSPGDAVGLAVVADLLGPSRIDRAVLVDPHVAQADAIFRVPLEVVSGVQSIADDLKGSIVGDAVVVAPDLGAVALAERYARALGIDEMSAIRKTRVSGSDVSVTGLVGDIVDRSPIIVDDMISTGGTIAATIRLLREQGSPEHIVVAATHGVFVDDAVADLLSLQVERLVVSDSLPNPYLPAQVTIVGLAQTLADTIVRLSDGGQP